MKVRVVVTAEDIEAAAEAEAEDRPGTWSLPVERALRRMTGQDVDVDGSEGDGNIATIGQEAWTLVVDLPADANRWLNERFDGGGGARAASEPIAFDVEVPDWLTRFLGQAVEA